MLLGLQPENVRVIFTTGSGCYGINGADTVSYDAALLSQAVGKPVRVQLSRKDEMAWENYGLAFVIDQRAGARRRAATSSPGTTKRGPPRSAAARATNTPGNVVTGFLAGFEPAAVHAAIAGAGADRATRQRQQRGAVVRRRHASAARAAATGTVRSERVLTHTVRSPFFTGPLRSPERLQNTFAHECFIDEIAAHVKADPVAYRLRHLSDRAADRRRACGGEGGELGARARRPSRRSPATGVATRAAASRACSTKATTATARWWPKSTSIRTRGRSP